MNPLVERTVITPVTAQALLALNGRNRTVKSSRVAAYANDMRNGRWRFTGDTIKIATTPEGDRLVDGQHRLAAVIESGCGVEMLIVRGIDESSMPVIDTGVSRSPADALRIGARVGGAKLAAAAKLVLVYDAGVFANVGHWSVINVTRPVLIDFVNQNADEFEQAMLLGNQLGRIGFSPTPVGAWFFLANRIEPYNARLSEYIDQLTYGVGLTDGSAALAMRNWVMHKRAGSSLSTRRTALTEFSALIRSWNHYVQGNPVRIVRAWRRGEEFPRLIGDDTDTNDDDTTA